eukprot:366531-Chlamydomonas_euryale.AAC.7
MSVVPSSSTAARQWLLPFIELPVLAGTPPPHLKTGNAAISSPLQGQGGRHLKPDLQGALPAILHFIIIHTCHHFVSQTNSNL